MTKALDFTAEDLLESLVYVFGESRDTPAGEVLDYAQEKLAAERRDIEKFKAEYRSPVYELRPHGGAPINDVFHAMVAGFNILLDRKITADDVAKLPKNLQYLYRPVTE